MVLMITVLMKHYMRGQCDVVYEININVSCFYLYHSFNHTVTFVKRRRWRSGNGPVVYVIYTDATISAQGKKLCECHFKTLGLRHMQREKPQETITTGGTCT